MVIRIVRADRIAARVRVTRATGASWRHRIGHDPDRPARLGRIERRPGDRVPRRSTRYARPHPCRATRGRAATADPASERQPNCRRACSPCDRRSRSVRPGRQAAGTLAPSRERCERSLSTATSRSSVGMTVDLLPRQLLLRELAEDRGPVFPPGIAISDASRASTALSMMNPTSPATASASSSSDHIPTIRLRSCYPLLGYRGARCAYPNHPATACPVRSSAGRKRSRSWARLQTSGIDRRDAAAAVDRAFADVAARIDSEPYENRRAARPLLEQLAREVAARKHGSDAAAADRRRPYPRHRPGRCRRRRCRSRCRLPRRPSGSGNRRRALRRSGAFARRFAGCDLRHRRDDHLRLGRVDRGRLALDVRRRRAAFFLLGLGLLASCGGGGGGAAVARQTEDAHRLAYP